AAGAALLLGERGGHGRGTRDGLRRYRPDPWPLPRGDLERPRRTAPDPVDAPARQRQKDDGPLALGVAVERDRRIGAPRDGGRAGRVSPVVTLRIERRTRQPLHEPKLIRGSPMPHRPPRTLVGRRREEVIRMKMNVKRMAIAGFAVVALALAGRAASAQTPATPGNTPVTSSEATAGPDTDNIREGNQTTPDNAVEAVSAQATDP